MAKSYQPLFSEPCLRSFFSKEFKELSGSEKEQSLTDKLKRWDQKSFQKETSAESAFLSVFFEDIWGYEQSGKTSQGKGFTCYPKYPIAGAGAGGGTGEADLALGYFDFQDIPETPQALCEFKDIRSNLDAPQKRKGNTRSPVKQCADYLREASKPLYGNEAIQPTWGIVTDMNEFRLYRRKNMPSQYQRFSISPKTGDDVAGLLGTTEAASFQRFLFTKFFSVEFLLTTSGPPGLVQLLQKQWVQEKEIENAFYKEYRFYRERLIKLITAHNPLFEGTKGKLVRLAQKLIDRCIFVLFCEDMGEALSFPPNALRDYLAELSQMSTYDKQAGDAWSKLKELFQAMNEGRTFFSKQINQFNGGLFETDPELEGLYVPNEAFCARRQGEADNLTNHPDTLLYLSAVYNFGTSGNSGKAITLYTLGRIFEQSITELEALEAKADGRRSLTEITKRKRDGVYYTPEWVVEHIVSETLGPRLDEIRAECGWSVEIEGGDGFVKEQRTRSPSKQSVDFKRHVEGVRKFQKRLEAFTVCDPACGSGAFLIHALEYLLRERRWVIREYDRIGGHALLGFKPDDEIRNILSKNIYGVDINPASVEITQLALWLHTAKADQPLSNLDQHIKCRNSLIGPIFYEWRKDLLSWTEDQKETINIFDWNAAFPEVFSSDNPGGPGFDCIVGNPPYVKLQNFRKVHPEMAEYLKDGEIKADIPVYESTQSGNFDLFLPFIEKSISLLNARGGLGFIAPSLWRYNEYGDGLKKFLKRGGHLERWIDFGSFQVFEEAITYTALQFYTRDRKEHVCLKLAPDGEMARAPDWGDQEWLVPYVNLPEKEIWAFVSRSERNLLNKLNSSCRRLGDPKITKAIFQGLITSDDYVYHLKRSAPDRYWKQPKKLPGRKAKPEPVELEIEDTIMHPLVSGEEASRYQAPETDIYVLFPYEVTNGQVRLFTQDEMAARFPKAWGYLRSYESELCRREKFSDERQKKDGKLGPFDDDTWYRFGRHQNLDKQEFRKLIVAQTVSRMSVCPDTDGEFYINNVRANGIFPTSDNDFWYLLGILNCSVVDWAFRRIGKPKEGGYFEANKQFIAPLPIPKANATQRKMVAKLAEELTVLHTKRRDTLRKIEHRLSYCSAEEQPEKWLCPSVHDAKHWKTNAPADLPAREKTRWAKEQFTRCMEERFQALSLAMRPGISFAPRFQDGELSISIGGAVAIDGIFLDEDEGQQALLSWCHLARTLNLTEGLKPKAFAKKLRTIYRSNNSSLISQWVKLDKEIASLELNIEHKETELNRLAYDLYQLTEDEISMVKHG